MKATLKALAASAQPNAICSRTGYTWQSAVELLRKSRQRGRLRPYFCATCDAWHVARDAT